jgi:hypothetical protein
MKKLVTFVGVLTIAVLGTAFQSNSGTNKPSGRTPPDPPRDDDRCEELAAAIADWASDEIEVRAAASQVAREIVKAEVVRIDNLIREEFPIIVSFEQYDEIDARRKEHEQNSCVFLLLREAINSSDAEVRARAQEAVRPAPSPLDGAIFSLED